ncbi:MAG: prepilin-type N-terminal cleavage/methylation domain-containing protein [Cyanobacteria bacterium J06621_8]
MLPYPVRKPEKGFTLIEIIVVTIIVGIIGAIAIPSFFALLNRNRVNQAIGEIEGALREAQNRATRNGRSCQISINAATNTISNTGANDTCLLTTRNINTDFTLATSRPNITFSGKGNIALAPQVPVIVLADPNGGSNQQSCVVIENSLGSIRTGEYTGTIPAIPLPGSCQ